MFTLNYQLSTTCYY